MNAITAAEPASSAGNDRLGVTLLFSLIVHAVLILGIGFELAKPKPSLPALDVTLLNTANALAPDKADFLAQANNAGGGDSDQSRRPSARFSGPLPTDAQGVAPIPLQQAAPAPSPASAPRVLAADAPADRTVTTAPERLEQSKTAPRQSATPIDRQLEMARLAQEVRVEEQAYAKRPRKKFISANTREYAYAAYMKAWVARIERVGNLNYPDEARRRRLHGQLVLTVGLARDGRIMSIDIIQSSGRKVLDDAAIRIVHLSAPFPAIPHSGDTGPDKIDELYITRTWQFLRGDELQTR
ncbi:MAG: energy transducer TonB [Proteobacteria bacterium]|nr:energy transducer TonB [Pseudomonadota bacterium]